MAIAKNSLIRAFGIAALVGVGIYGGAGLVSNGYSSLKDIESFTAHTVFLSRVTDSGEAELYNAGHECLKDEISARIAGPVVAAHFLQPKSLLESWHTADAWIAESVVSPSIETCQDKGHDMASIRANLAHNNRLS